MNATETSSRLEIDLPPGFAGMPVANDDDLNRRHAWAVGQKLAGSAGKTSEEFGGYLMALVPTMQRNGVRVFGKFAVGERPADLATLTLSVAQWPDGGDPAVLAAAYRRRHPAADVQLVRLPIGPAMAAIEGGEFRLPPEVTGQPVEQIRPRIQAVYQIPLPDGEFVAILSVTAESEEAWPAVMQVTAGVAHSLRRRES
jgi:hypothetical protein